MRLEEAQNLEIGRHYIVSFNRFSTNKFPEYFAIWGWMSDKWNDEDKDEKMFKFFDPRNDLPYRNDYVLFWISEDEEWDDDEEEWIETLNPECMISTSFTSVHGKFDDIYKIDIVGEYNGTLEDFIAQIEKIKADTNNV